MEIGHLIEHSVQLRLILDERHQVSHASPAAAELFNMPLAQLLGKDLADLLSYEDPAPSLTGEFPVDAVLNDGRQVQVSVELLPGHPPQTLLNVRIPSKTLPIRSNFKVLASGVAHDLNNLLLGILGHSELALRAQGEQAGREHLATIQLSAKRAAELTGQMLAYIGRGNPERAALNLSDLVREVSRLVSGSVSPDIRFRFDLQTGLPLFVVDPTLARQLLMNLMINAAEAYPDGEGEVWLKTGAVTLTRQQIGQTRLPDCRAGRFVFVDVIDAGGGMSTEVVERMFEFLYTTKSRGSGVGLSSCLETVRAQGGTISVQSQPGRGTSIRVLFKVSRLEPPAGPPMAPSCPREGRRLLLVDDDPTVRETCSQLLQVLGYEVLQADDGERALELLDNHQDLAAVLLDLTMPGLGGSRTCEQVRKRQPELPIIILSGYGGRALIGAFAPKRFQLRAPEAFLEKPFDLKTLELTLFNVLGRS